MPTARLVARNAQLFAALRDALDLSWDDFLRTSADPRHRPGVERLWRTCGARGDLYRHAYDGLYCVGCEQFYAPAELVAGHCPEHAAPLERVHEENWFFRLSRYAPTLRAEIRSGRLRIVPAGRRNEILALIDAGVPDLSVSRSRERARGWGIPVPGDPDQVVYVWFDALANYVTSLGYGSGDAALERWWHRADERVHLIGKGITRFHALYWPAILLSAGLPLPDRILVHGYVTARGAKIGKSEGNAVDPVALAAHYGPDSLRFFLLRHLRTTEDGDFEESRLRDAYARELAGQLGNLLHRSTSMLRRWTDGRIPAAGSGGAWPARAARLDAEIAAAVDRFALHEALAALWRFVGELNAHAQRAAPWEQHRRASELRGVQGKRALRARDAALYELAEGARLVAVQLAPFLPGTARSILARLGDAPDSRAWGALEPGRPARVASVLFPPCDARAPV